MTTTIAKKKYGNKKWLILDPEQEMVNSRSGKSMNWFYSPFLGVYCEAAVFFFAGLYWAELLIIYRTP